MKKNKLIQTFVGISLLAVFGLGLNMLLGGIGNSNRPASDPPYPPPAETQGLLAYPPPDPTIVSQAATSVAYIDSLSDTGPTETIPPVPTLPPTPIVTPVPRVIFPISPLDVSDLPLQYSIIFPDDNSLKQVESENFVLSEVLDVFQASSGYLVDRSFGLRIWGGSSPDGSRIAVVISTLAAPVETKGAERPSYSIQIFDTASGALMFVIEDGVNPDWSPDGTMIAYRSTKTHGLWIADLETGQTDEIFAVDRSELDYWVSFTSWAPDSDRISLVRTFGMLERGEVWIVDLKQANKPIQLLPFEMYAGPINWSPKGDQILFLSTSGEYVASEPPYSIWVVDLSSSDLHQLTHNMTISGGTPQWSPDGRWIAFPGINLLEGEKLQYDLWLVSSDGEGLHRLTDDADFEQAPTWADGVRIVYLRVGAGVWEINLLDGEFRVIYPEDVPFAVQQ